MKFLPFILKHLRRNWIRTTSTVLAMAVCIFLFCTLQTLIAAVTWNLKSAGAARLNVRNNISLVFPMPNSYEPRIAAVAGVKRVAIFNWFGGLRDLNKPTDFFPNFAVEAENFLPMYPEYILTEDQKRRFLSNQRGCIVGPVTAKKFGWKEGDTVQLESNIAPYRVGKPFEFVIEGIYATDQKLHPGTNDTALFFHYKYLDEATKAVSRSVGVGMYRVEINDPKDAGAVSKAIDGLFEDSEAQTHTETEAAFRASFVSLAGNLSLLLNGIAVAVMFTILLVTANTMSMAIRERRTEIAVLKTLGFPSGLVMGLVLSEAMMLGALGGGVGLLLGRAMIQALPHVPLLGDAVSAYPNLGLSAKVGLLGMAVALFLGLAAGFIPSFLAYRAKVTELLRQV
jgi:putative ABC transport system permease protein